MSLPSPRLDDVPDVGGVRLREFLDADAEMVMDLATDPYVPNISSLPARADRTAALAWIERQRARPQEGVGYSLCVARSKDGLGVGWVGLWLSALAQGRATAGYAVAPAHRGHRYAASGLSAVAQLAWTIPELNRIELYIEPRNAASEATAKLVGFSREGLLRSHQVIAGRPVDMLLYAAIRTTN